MSFKDDELKLTLQALKDSFSSTEKKQHQEVITILKELSQNIYHHIQVLMKGITLESDIVSLDLKKSIIIYLKGLINSRNKELKEEELLSILQFILEALISSNLPQELFPFFYDIIIHIGGTEYFIKNTSHIYQIMAYLTKTVSQAQNENFLKLIIKVIEILFSLLKSKAVCLDTIEEVLKQLLCIIDIIFAAVQNYINQTDGINGEFINVLQSTYDFMYFLVTKMKGMKFDYTKMQFLFQKYGLYTYELIILTLGNKDPDSIIYITANNDLDLKINFMKGKALQFFSILLQSCNTTINDEQLIISCSEIIMQIIKSLTKIIETNFALIDSLAGTDFKNGLHHFIYHMFSFLMRALVRIPIKDNFTPLVNNFIVDIIFPLIISTKHDIQSIKDSGEEYFFYINDLIDGHKIKSFRTAAASLLQKLCNKYVDTYSFVLSFILQFLDSLLNEDKSNMSKYYLLSVLKPNSIIATMSDEYKFDICLLILILLQETLNDNISYTKILRNILTTYNDKLLSITSPLILDKICLLHYYFLLPLFRGKIPEHYNYFQSIFNFLMNTLLNNNKYPALEFHSANTLKEILLENSEEHISFFNEVINNNMTKINSLIEESDVYLFFDILIYIVKNISIYSEEMKYWFLTKIIRRMHTEILNGKANGIKEKCFMILTQFLEKNTLTNNGNSQLTIEVFESLIQPIVAYLKNPNKIEFEEEIILLMETLIQTTQTVTPLANSIVPLLQLTVEKNKALSEIEYSFLTKYIKYDINGEKTASSLNDILALIYQGYQIDSYDGADLSMLLSIELLEKNIPIDQNTLTSLLSKAYVSILDIKVPIKGVKTNIEEEYIMQCGIGVICVAMISNPEKTMEFLQSNNYFLNFLGQIKASISFAFYSIKIFKQFILGLCSLIHHPETQKKIVEMNKMNQIIAIMFSLVNKQKFEEVQRLNKKMKKELHCNFINDNESDDSDSDSDNDDNFIDDELDNEHFLEFFSKPSKAHYFDEKIKYTNLIDEMSLQNDKLDEYSIFTQCLQGINHDYLMAFNATLTDQDKNIMTQILLIKKVEVQYNNQIMSAPRRIVKIKKNNNDGENSTRTTTNIPSNAPIDNKK